MKAILGKKIGMTRVFDKDGQSTSVTVVEAGPCTVTQVKSQLKDNYQAIQIGFDESKHLNKPQQGHLKIAVVSSRVIKEYRLDKNDTAENNDINQDPAASPKEYKVGDKILADIFVAGEFVKVTGVSKGKGFAGTVKRHGFTTGPKTHGSHNYRAPGSIGSTWPERVIKGKRMPGHMGAKQITTEGLEIIDVDKDRNILVIKGAIPGTNNSTVFIKSE